MRAVIQRVREASVAIDGEVRASIGQGLLVLLGIEDADTEADVEWLAGKVARIRVFADGEGRINLSCPEVNGDMLVISQFTLFASTKKGNRPSFLRAAQPEKAIPLYENFLTKMEAELGHPVARGEFGADMKVSLTNDGPVTILIDSQNRE